MQHHQFYSEIAHEVHKPRKQNNNLNLRTIEQIRASGVEVKFYKMRNTNVGAARINPLDKLLDKGFLTQQEYCAGKQFQHDFEISNLDNFAKPSLIYDGLPSSARSTKSNDGEMSQYQINASRRIYAIKAKLNLASNYATHHKNGKFKIISLKLPEILKYIFEEEMAIENAQTLLKLHRNAIKDRIKKVCQILI